MQAYRPFLGFSCCRFRNDDERGGASDYRLRIDDKRRCSLVVDLETKMRAVVPLIIDCGTMIREGDLLFSN